MKEIVKQLKDQGIIDDAAKNFITVFENCDNEQEAFQKYCKSAVKEVKFDKVYIGLRFNDGSIYVDYRQGIDCFYPDIETLREDDPDAAEKFE